MHRISHRHTGVMGMNLGAQIFKDFLLHVFLLVFVASHHPTLKANTNAMLHMYHLFLGTSFFTVLVKGRRRDVATFLVLFVVLAVISVRTIF